MCLFAIVMVATLFLGGKTFETVGADGGTVTHTINNMFEKENINLTLENGYLTVEAKREEKEEDQNNYVRRERTLSAKRTYYVGEMVTEEDIKAKYKSGTLTINVPKKQKEQRKIKNIKID